MREAREAMAQQGRKFLGAKTVRQQPFDAMPKTIEPRRNPNPRIAAAHTPERVQASKRPSVQAIRNLLAFRPSSATTALPGTPGDTETRQARPSLSGRYLRAPHLRPPRLRAGLPGVAGVHSHTRQPDSRLARNCNDDRGGGLFVCRGRAAHRACGGALTLAAAALEAVVDHHVATDGVGTSAIGSAASSREVIPGRVC